MRRVISRLAAFSIALAAILCASEAVAGVSNGNFEDGAGDVFTDWQTEFGFAAPTSATDTDRYVVMSDSGAGTQLGQIIDFTSSSTTLSFDYLWNRSGASGSGAVPDGFQAALFDFANPVELFPGFELEPGVLPSGDSLFQPAFLSIDDSGVILESGEVSKSTTATGLRAGWTRVTLDVSSIGNQSLRLDFAVTNGTDAGVTSTAFIDNVVLASTDTNVVPEPSSIACFAAMAVPAVLLRKRRRRS